MISDNLNNIYNAQMSNGEIIIKKEDVAQNADYIDVKFDEFGANMGDDGYYVIADAGKKGSYLCRFTNKAEFEKEYAQNLMPIFGVKNKNGCVLGIVTGMKYIFNVVFGLKDGKYYFYLRFKTNGDIPEEDIKIKLVKLNDDADYSDMANIYREYQLSNGNCEPLKKRMKNNEKLKYAAECPEVRIRMAWKPAPPSVLEQTPENEPEMYVACTFDRVRDIIDEFKKQGIDKAQFCLVGWNISGHDGRYPQIFPVEPKLGGEQKLRELIDYAKKNGYGIVCHTNSTDAYNIAEDFDKDKILVKNKDGSFCYSGQGWSGGRMYRLCPEAALEFAKRDLPKVKELGFEGLHYIDVMSVIPLLKCYDKSHPSNYIQTLERNNEIMKMCRSLFGGFASEGTFDFAAKYLDYGLYVSWPRTEYDCLDDEIPLWPLVYHGIILSNSTTDTVNYTVKDKKNHLRCLEYGSRPSFYFYSKFMTGGNIDWLGREDIMCDTDEQLKYSVSKIKEAYDEYKKTYRLQTEFMVSHKKTAPDEYTVTYSDGSKVVVNYKTQEYKFI